MVQQLCLTFWRLLQRLTSSLGCWSCETPTFDLIIPVKVGWSDLYFVFQLFWRILKPSQWMVSCLVSWFHVISWLTSSYTWTGVQKVSHSSESALYLENRNVDKHHAWNVCSVWHQKWHLDIYRPVWPTFQDLALSKKRLIILDPDTSGPKITSIFFGLDVW